MHMPMLIHPAAPFQLLPEPSVSAWAVPVAGCPDLETGFAKGTPDWLVALYHVLWNDIRLMTQPVSKPCTAVPSQLDSQDQAWLGCWWTLSLSPSCPAQVLWNCTRWAPVVTLSAHSHCSLPLDIIQNWERRESSHPSYLYAGIYMGNHDLHLLPKVYDYSY